MNCDEFSEKLDSYIHGELTETERAEMDAHISGCENCRTEAEFARKINASLKNLPPIKVPPDFKEKLYEKIKTEKKKRFYNMWQPYAALAACVVLAVVLKTGAGDMLGTLNTGDAVSTPTPSVQTSPTDVPMRAASEPAVQPESTQDTAVQPAKTESAASAGGRTDAKSGGSARTVGEPARDTGAASVPAQTAVPERVSGEETQKQQATSSAESVGDKQAVQSEGAPASDTDTDGGAQIYSGKAAKMQTPEAAHELRSLSLDDTTDITAEDKTRDLISGGTGGEPEAASYSLTAGAVSARIAQVLNVDSSGLRIANSFMKTNVIDNENGAYSVTREELNSLLGELDENGVRYELSFDLDECGDIIYLVINEF